MGQAVHMNPRQPDMNTSYSDFLVTHSPLFSGMKDPHKAGDWFCTTKSKVQSASLYKVSKYSICRSVAQRLSTSLVGIIHRCTTS
jgi:hypothetical protein